MNSSEINTKKELLEHIKHDWTALNSYLAELSEAELTEVKNADDWTVKDHVAHLATWENSVIVLFKGKPRHEGLGISRDLYINGGIDAVNHAIFKNNQDKTLAEVEAVFRRTHNELLSLIHDHSDEDLNLPYSHYLPDEEQIDGPRLLTIIYGNTAYHYREHQQWIEEMLVSEST